MIKGVDREKWVTVNKIPVLLKVTAAMAAEAVGVCVFTGVLDLILCKSLNVQNINQSNPDQLTDSSCSFDYPKRLSHNAGACQWTTLRALVDGQTCL